MLVGIMATLGGIVVLALVVVYYVLLIRAILEMLRSDTNLVLLISSFVALVCLPPLLPLGIAVIIIWHFHKARPAASAEQHA